MGRGAGRRVFSETYPSLTRGTHAPEDGGLPQPATSANDGNSSRAEPELAKRRPTIVSTIRSFDDQCQSQEMLPRSCEPSNTGKQY